MTLLLCLLAAVPLWTQQRDLWSDDQHNGRLRGRVVAADTGRPVARAHVTATALGAKTSPGYASTDLVGGFEINNLPPGRYIVVASKPGAFLDTQYGQVHPDLPGKQVSVSAESEAFIDIAMARPGVIAGRVFDEAGDPLPKAAILALRQQPAGSGHGLQRSGFVTRGGGTRIIFGSADERATTNDRGEFRIFGLLPGDYLLMGLPGTPRGADRRPAAIYFPGVTDPSAAARLQIGPGQEIANADFTLRYLPTIMLSGVAVGPDGQPLSSGSISLHVSGVEGLRGLTQVATIRKDGSFRLEALSGQYILRARHQLVGAPGSSRYSGDLSVAVPLTVGDADVPGLFLQLTYGAMLKGRMVFEGPAPPPSTEKRFRVMVESGTPGAVVAAGRNADDTFTMSGIEAGPRRLNTTAPPGWTLKTVVVDGRDVWDLPIEFRDGVAVENVSLVFTTVRSPLSISVEHARGSAAAALAVFPQDPRMWHSESRRTVFRTITDNPLVVDMLPAGDYLVAAIADVAAKSLDAGDVKLLERLRPFAEHVRTAEGLTTAIEVRTIVLPQ